MAETTRSPIRRALIGLGVLALIALGDLGVRMAQALPNGPEPIAWDQEVCAHCRMHVGDPHFAAQLQTRDHQILDFDDPGCLLRYLAEHPDAPVHAAYVHHLREDRWILLGGAGFVEVAATPMGYGLGAVDASAPGAMNLDAAKARAQRGHLATGSR